MRYGIQSESDRSEKYVSTVNEIAGIETTAKVIDKEFSSGDYGNIVSFMNDNKAYELSVPSDKYKLLKVGDAVKVVVKGDNLYLGQIKKKIRFIL